MTEDQQGRRGGRRGEGALATMCMSWSAVACTTRSVGHAEHPCDTRSASNAKNASRVAAEDELPPVSLPAYPHGNATIRVTPYDGWALRILQRGLDSDDAQ